MRKIPIIHTNELQASYNLSDSYTHIGVEVKITEGGLYLIHYSVLGKVIDADGTDCSLYITIAINDITNPNHYSILSRNSTVNNHYAIASLTNQTVRYLKQGDVVSIYGKMGTGDNSVLEPPSMLTVIKL